VKSREPLAKLKNFMINFIFLTSLLIFLVFASFDLLLPPIPPSGLNTQRHSRANFQRTLDGTINYLRDLPFTDDQKSNLSKLLFFYIKSFAYRDCAPSLAAIEKSSVIVILIFFILTNDLEARKPDFDLVEWTTVQERFNGSNVFSWSLLTGNRLGEIIQSFEMLFPADAEDLRNYFGEGNKCLFSNALNYISGSQEKHVIECLEPHRANKIFRKIDPLKEKLVNSLPTLVKLRDRFKPIFEPLGEQFRLTLEQLQTFSDDFLEYALVSFYEEHFTSNQELSEALFGTDVQLTDLNGKEINWCFEISSLRKKYLLGLKKQFPQIDDDDNLSQLKREIFNFLGHHKTDSKSFVINLHQTHYFALSEISYCDQTHQEINDIIGVYLSIRPGSIWRVWSQGSKRMNILFSSF
jgi:hypothetical protein